MPRGSEPGYRHPVLVIQSDLFKGLESASIDRIKERLKTVVFNRGTVICREGDPGASMFMIVKGKVSVTKKTGWGQRELQQMKRNPVKQHRAWRPGHGGGHLANRLSLAQHILDAL